MGNLITRSSKRDINDIYITCLDKMEKGYAVPTYHKATCKQCQINIYQNFNFNNTNLIDKNDTCFNCKNNKNDYIIDILPSISISS